MKERKYVAMYKGPQKYCKLAQPVVMITSCVLSLHETERS